MQMHRSRFQRVRWFEEDQACVTARFPCFNEM